MALQLCRIRFVFNAHLSSDSKVGALNCISSITVLIVSIKFPIPSLGFFPNTDFDFIEHKEATSFCNLLPNIFIIACRVAPFFIAVVANELKFLLINGLHILRLDGVMTYDLGFR